MPAKQPPLPVLSEAKRTRALILLIISTFVALIGQFMTGPLIVVVLSTRDVPVSIIGLFAASSWLGILSCTPYAAWVVQRLGSNAALLASLLIPALAFSAVAVSDSIVFWALLYFIAGAAMALRWVVGEACVAELAPPHRRGRLLGISQTLYGASFVLAPTLLAWVGPTEPQALWLAIALLLLGYLITMALPTLPTQTGDDHKHGLKGLHQAMLAAPALMIAGMMGGFFELGITNMLPAYGLAIGFSITTAALLVAASGMGSATMMMPIGEAADKLSRRTILLSCAATCALASGLLPLAANTSWLAWPLAFLWGGAGGSLYTVCMIDIGHKNSGGALISATAMLVLSYTIGGLIGPIATGLAIQASPRYVLPAVFFGIAVIGWLALARYYPRDLGAARAKGRG